MLPLETSSHPPVGQLAKTHTFRFLTVIATWAMIFAAYLNHREWIEAWWRFSIYLIKTIADQLPEWWGSQLDILLLGGVIWIQITSAIIFLRVILWLPFHLWRVSFHLWRVWRERSIMLNRS